MDDEQLDNRPFFSVRLTESGCATHGVATCQLGDQLPRPGQAAADGIFAWWAWDGQRLRAGNDRCGFHPLFYFATSTGISLSPSLPRLLREGAALELDEVALAVFLRLGFFLGQDTPFQAIRALPPDATLEWERGQLRVAGGLYLARPLQLPRDALVDRYASLFRQAVERQVARHHTVIVPLSGGRDSRHILLELCAAGRHPEQCVTLRHFPPRSNQDTEVATRLAAALGVPHVVLDQTEPKLSAERRKNLRTSFCADENVQFMALADFLDGKTCTVYDGIGGDVLSAGLFLTPRRLELFQAGRLAELAEHLLGDEGRVSSLLSREQLAVFSRQKAASRLVGELERHAAAPNPLGSFYFWNRTRREIATIPYAIYPDQAQKLCPYLDHDLYDFLASIPAESFLDHAFHTETIARAYPAYADLPYEQKGLPDNRRGYPRYLQRLVRDLNRYINQQDSRLVSRPEVKKRLLYCYIAGREPSYFHEQLIYLLQIERLTIS